VSSSGANRLFHCEAAFDHIRTLVDGQRVM